MKKPQSDPAPDLAERVPGEAGPVREARDVELERSGWERRFTGAPPRLKEVQELYERLGLEVLLDPLSADELPQGCDDCTLATSWFKVVYTRESRASVRPARSEDSEDTE